MRIAISSTGEGLEARVDSRFGRAPLLLVFDEATGGLDSIDNRDAAGASGGAGIRAAERVIASGAKCLLTGHCGPNAFRALGEAGIEVYSVVGDTVIGDTVGAALEAHRAGKFHRIGAPTSSGHVE